MNFGGLSVVPLHRHREYLKLCCDLLNDEWPRSETARMISLEASNDNLPTSLILLEESKLLLGHCKLSIIPSIPESCFVEAVVIKKDYRGRKLGTFLMKYVEQYCRDALNLKMVHLSTKGQEKFYKKLGYEVCSPVSIYGRPVISYQAPTTGIKEQCETKLVKSADIKDGVLPPSPPPPPISKITASTNSRISSNKTYMYKVLN